MPEDLPESAVPLAEISQGPNAFEEFLDRNQKSLIVVAILLAIGTAAFVVYQGIEKSRQDTAGEAFNKADDLAALKAVTTEHPGTHAAQSAMVLLADRQWNEGQQDAAIATLQSFIASSPDHPAALDAQASLGAKLMAQGKNDEASKVFRNLADEPSARYIAPYALISLGDIAGAAGNVEDAEIAYNRVKADFSESTFVETATRRIATLKAKPPVEIEPPPAATTPAAAPAVTPAPPAPEAAPVIESSSTEDEVPSSPQPASPENNAEDNSGETPSDSNP